ncbi:MAG: hypothetical protein IJ026_06930 [Candidatus Methanomethylophilaceae archaeon]|nr:hypothetical protein [Candidatus Methanomethylophilaceae archaeon]
MRQDLTFDDAEGVFAERGMEFGEGQMVSLGMIRDGMFTNLAYLLSDQCTHGIKLALFGDEFKNSFIDCEEVSGCVLTQLGRACAFVDRYNGKRSRIAGMYRRDERDYPPEAIWEVMVNAVAHRDYALDGSTMVSMSGDCMSVSSMGSIPQGLGSDDVAMGITSCRNEGLVSILYRLGMMETYGTGHV